LGVGGWVGGCVDGFVKGEGGLFISCLLLLRCSSVPAGWLAVAACIIDNGLGDTTRPGLSKFEFHFRNVHLSVTPFQDAVTRDHIIAAGDEGVSNEDEFVALGLMLRLRYKK
jgi:hypothetical protein